MKANKMYDPCHSVQVIIRCDLCKENIEKGKMYCDYCHVNLCKPCIGDHIADEYDKHKIVSIQDKKSNLIFPTCKAHLIKTCEMQCKSCNRLICVLCFASPEHKGHEFMLLEDIYKTTQADIKKETEEMEKIIVPTYGEIRNDLIKQITKLDKDYKKIETEMSKQGEKWHREVDRVVIKMKKEISEIKETHQNILEKHLNEIKLTESLIEGKLLELNKLEESNDVSAILNYKPKQNEFRKLPPKVHATLPIFCPMSIEGEQFYEMFGSLKPFVSTTDKNGYKMIPHDFQRKLLEIPQVIKYIYTGYTLLRSISVNNEELWTSAKFPDIKCLSTDGKCMQTITTKSGHMPNDIGVTSEGDLVYCDWKLKTLNKMKDGKIEEIIKLQGWTPTNLCVTSATDLLVSLYNDEKTQAKVVRYSGSVEKQTLQYNEDGKPMYSENNKIKYISENRNQDICVADTEAGAIVVVNQDGKLRFCYTGHPSGDKVNLFEPFGITTNSLSQILTADLNNQCIHIIDQDGEFLRYIENMLSPFGLCTDKVDNLFVAEFLTGYVRVIRYLK